MVQLEFIINTQSAAQFGGASAAAAAIGEAKVNNRAAPAASATPPTLAPINIARNAKKCRQFARRLINSPTRVAVAQTRRRTGCYGNKAAAAALRWH